MNAGKRADPDIYMHIVLLEVSDEWASRYNKFNRLIVK